MMNFINFAEYVAIHAGGRKRYERLACRRMGAAKRRRARDLEDDLDTSEDMPAGPGKLRPVGDPDVAFIPVKEIVKGRKQWRNSGIRAHCDVANAPPLEGVDAGPTSQDFGLIIDNR